MTYAGFWKRFAAAFIDLVIISLLGGMAGFIFGISFAFFMGGEGTEELVSLLGFITSTITGWIYFAAFESSPKQGTLGKIALGIKVTDLDGDPISFGKATGRYFAKYISSLTLSIGYLMVALTKKNQGLHDKISGCLVINKEK